MLMTTDPNNLTPSGGAPDWRVDISERGRTGSVSYTEPAGSVLFTWEFGGGDTVAIIYFDDETSWRSKHPWTTGRRTEILQRVADAVIQQKAPNCRAEIDERAGWINLRQAAPPCPPTPPNHFAFRARKARLSMMLAIFVVVLAAAAIGFKTIFTTKSPTGAPLELSVRTPQHIATLIQTLEPYVPSLQRNPDNDRYRLALFLYPLDGSSPGKMIPIANGLRVRDFNLAKLLGCDGSTVWFNLNGIGGVSLKTEKLVSEADLRRANSVLTTRDRTTLPFAADLQDYLSAGVRPTPTEWLALLSTKEAALEYQPKSWLSRLNQAQDAKQLRRMHRAQLGPELDRGNREILSMAAVSAEEFLNAAFVRAAASADPLRLSAPDSFLMTYTSKAGRGGTLMVARVDATGHFLWKADTGIERFKLAQVLPDAHNIAFVGTRPPVPNQVPEPLVVIVDNKTGAVSTSTLWK